MISRQAGSRFSLFLSVAGILSLSACAAGRSVRSSETAPPSATVAAETDDGVEEAEPVPAEEAVDADRTPQEAEKEFEAVSEPSADPKSEKEVEQQILAADQALMEEAPRSDAEKREGHPRVPIEINERVRKWIHYFTSVDRARFA